jgi:cysteinyl-tRNA synthetase, unknown class
MKHFLTKYLVLAVCGLAISSCSEDIVKPDYREEMRQFVIRISERGEQLRPGFIVIPQNGMQLLTSEGGGNGAPATAYINAIDGCGQEELFYGYDNQNNFVSSNYEEQQQWLAQCRFAVNHGLEVLVTDYCSVPALKQDSYNRCDAEGFLDFVAESRELDLIPADVHNENTNDVDSLSQAMNFLYMINPQYETKQAYVEALALSRHDVLIIDAFFNETEALTTADLAMLQTKPQGGRRLVIAYMSIGQAESYRWYWKPFWMATPPSFLVQEDPYWSGNFYVNYWDAGWQNIIAGPGDSYVQRVVDAGFDGVYLDLVSAFEFFEDK